MFGVRNRVYLHAGLRLGDDGVARHEIGLVIAHRTISRDFSHSLHFTARMQESKLRLKVAEHDLGHYLRGLVSRPDVPVSPMSSMSRLPGCFAPLAGG